MPELKFVAFRGKSVVSRLIRYFTRSPEYSHIAVLVPKMKNTLIEAWNHEGGMKQWTDFSAIKQHSPGTRYEIWTLEVSEDVYKHCTNYYGHHAQQKTPYDYRGIIGFILKKTVKQNKKKLFCSELAITPLAEAREWDKVIPSHIDPGNFVDIIQAAGAWCKPGVV